jgi:hypothetical protein
MSDQPGPCKHCGMHLRYLRGDISGKPIWTDRSGGDACSGNPVTSENDNEPHVPLGEQRPGTGRPISTKPFFSDFSKYVRGPR